MEIRRSELQQDMFVVLDTQVSIALPQDANGKEADDLDVGLKIFTNNEEEEKEE